MLSAAKIPNLIDTHLIAVFFMPECCLTNRLAVYFLCINKLTLNVTKRELELKQVRLLQQSDNVL